MLTSSFFTTWTCPVCHYPGLEDPPDDYSICPRCGTEFGVDDDELTHAQLKARWVANGAKWFDAAAEPTAVDTPADTVWPSWAVLILVPNRPVLMAGVSQTAFWGPQYSVGLEFSALLDIGFDDASADALDASARARPGDAGLPPAHEQPELRYVVQ